MRLIYTIGTSRRSQEDFVETLLSYGVERVVDVRSFPQSRIPWFSMDALRTLAEENGLGYLWMGRELGGFRKGGYEAYAATDAFMEAVGRLEALASEKTSVVLCSERFPWKCHRRWIARELQRRGWRVEHILEKGRVWVAEA
ncbi:MAG: DUF488 domain-containing protein [Thermodesulfovibrionales bacterium]